MNEPMTEQHALNVLNEVAAKYQGSRNDHEVLLTAITTLQNLLNKLTGKQPDKAEP